MEDLPVEAVGKGGILDPVDLCLDQVVSGCGNGGGDYAGGQELEGRREIASEIREGELVRGIHFGQVSMWQRKKEDERTHIRRMLVLWMMAIEGFLGKG